MNERVNGEMAPRKWPCRVHGSPLLSDHQFTKSIDLLAHTEYTAFPFLQCRNLPGRSYARKMYAPFYVLPLAHRALGSIEFKLVMSV